MDYAERLSVPLRWWAQGTMLLATFWLAVLAAVPPDKEYIAWVVSAVAIAIMSLAFLSYGSARVSVSGGELVAGDARIPLDHVGAAVEVDAHDMRRLAGRDADARAYLLLRPYVHGGVRVEITDPADPTPYWLLSCRRPGLLADALNRAHTR